MRCIEYKHNIYSNDIIAVINEGEFSLSGLRAGSVFRVINTYKGISVELITTEYKSISNVGLVNAKDKPRFRFAYKNEAKHFL